MGEVRGGGWITFVPWREGYIRRGDLFETGYNVYCVILGGFSSSARVWTHTETKFTVQKLINNS